MAAKSIVNVSFWRVAYLGGLAHVSIALVFGALMVATRSATVGEIGLVLALFLPITLPIGVGVAYGIGRQERWRDAWGVLSALCGYPAFMYGLMTLPFASSDHLKEYPLVSVLYFAMAMALLFLFRKIGALILRVVAPDVKKPANLKAA